MPDGGVDARTPAPDGGPPQTPDASSAADVPSAPPDAQATDASTRDANDGRVPLGQLWNTYYWLSPEAEYSGDKTVELMNTACEPIATVSEAYADAVCIEGSGLLEDGRVINYAARCDCGRPCSSGTIICWSDLDPAQFPWGQGAFGNALVPLRSLAVDRDAIPLRTVVYLAQFDGLEIEAHDGIAAFTHDGCFRADDVGGAIEGDHIDIFAGTTAMWRTLEQEFPTRSTLDAWTDVAHCRYLEL